RSRSEFLVTNLMSFGVKVGDYDGLAGAKFFSVWQVGTRHRYVQEAMKEYAHDMKIVRDLLPDQPAATKAMTDRVFHAFGISGTPSECIKQLKDYAKAGLDHVAMMMPYGIPQATTINVVGSNIVSRL
ncbi:MAG: hypothetical protein ACTSW4_01755, partial [Candidatus Ranarchaeia archaeon]